MNGIPAGPLAPRQPQLSIVIPTYNRRASLEITLEGLNRQDYPHDRFEVIVVSDGSTDGTDAFLTSYVRKASYPLRVISQANAGPARARNRGVNEAIGEVIVFLDDDVEPLPGCLAAHAAHHLREPAVVVIGPMQPDVRRRAFEPPWIAWEHAMLEKQYENFRTGVWPGAGANHFYSGNASVRRSHLLDCGGFDENFPRQEDVELAYRMERQCGVHFLFENQAAALHRPSRTFASWFKVPYAYGRLDVVRARRGDVPWETVRQGYRQRSRATRLLASLTLTFPSLSAPLRGLLLSTAAAAYGLHLRRPSLAAMSVIYNLRYLEGVRDEMGEDDQFRHVLTGVVTTT